MHTNLIFDEAQRVVRKCVRSYTKAAVEIVPHLRKFYMSVVNNVYIHPIPHTSQKRCHKNPSVKKSLFGII